jgi:hypothetical protein
MRARQGVIGMRRLILFLATLAGIYAAARWWREHRRVGADLVNRVLDPWLERQGVVASSRGELGVIEHVGRRSGIVRRTLIHPVTTENGYRIIVPIGDQSEWARNVLAAGHCRLELDDRVIELDEPVLETPSEVPGLPPLVRAAFEWLGFRYLRLHTLREVEADVAAPSGVTAPTPVEPVPA